jgi:hypothetical protein
VVEIEIRSQSLGVYNRLDCNLFNMIIEIKLGMTRRDLQIVVSAGIVQLEIKRCDSQ